MPSFCGLLAFVFAAFSCVLSNVGLDVILMILGAHAQRLVSRRHRAGPHGVWYTVFATQIPQVWVVGRGGVAVQSVITLRSAMRSLWARGCRLMFFRWRISVPRGRRLPWLPL